MPLPRLRLTRESPLEEDSLRLLGKACALLPQFTLGEFCAVRPPPAHSKDRVESFSAVFRPLLKSQGFRTYELPKWPICEEYLNTQFEYWSTRLE